MPDSVRASWERVPLDGTLPARTRQGGTVVGQHIVSYGGCGQGGGDQDADLSCAGQDAFVVDTSRGTSITPATCASGRQGPLLIGNFNKYSTNFASQVFLTLGVHNSSLWEDERGLEHGEIVRLHNVIASCPLTTLNRTSLIPTRELGAVSCQQATPGATVNRSIPCREMVLLLFHTTGPWLAHRGMACQIPL